MAGYLADDRQSCSAVDGGLSDRPGALSHSLRTPLTTILGNASSLLQPAVDWDAESENRLLRGIVSESARLARTVDNILTLASISAWTLRPDFGHNPPGTHGGLPVLVIGAITTAAGGHDLPTEIGTGIPATMALVAAHGGTVSYPSAATGTRCVIRLRLEQPDGAEI